MELFAVEIEAKSKDKLRALDKFGLDLKHRAARQISPGKLVVPGILNGEQIREVEAAGYKVKKVSDLSQVAKERALEISRVDRFASAAAARKFEAREVEGYMTAAEVESALKSFRRRFPKLVTLIKLPEKTAEGRACGAVRLRAKDKPDRVGVLFTGSMHAREWGGSDACIAFISDILSAYRKKAPLVYGGKTFRADEIASIMENLDLFVFPDVNPDGKNYSQTEDMWWRKNRNGPGVDINRNFDFLWGSGIGTSTSLSSETYKGQAPFSEPETRNIKYLMDANPNIGYYLDIHSHGGLILYSWGDDNNQSQHPDQNFLNPAYDGKRGRLSDKIYSEYISPDEEKKRIALASSMNDALFAVRETRYEVKQAAGLYATSATSDDYAYGRHFLEEKSSNICAFTIEFGREFIPPIAEMKNIIKELCSAMTELCLALKDLP